MTGHIGFIGLGIMGSALSGHLQAGGYSVIGYDIDVGRAAEHRARGGMTAASVASVVQSAQIVITSLPSTAALATVVDEAAAQGRHDLIMVDTSTLGIEAKQAARARLEQCGGVLLDAPLSGTGAQARERDLVIFLSGDMAAKASVQPVLAAMSRAVYDAGSFGQGSRLKFVANLLVAVHNVAAAEALLLADRAGLDLDLVLAAVADGAGSSRMFEVRGPLMVRGQYEPATVRLEVFMKDLAIIDAFATDCQSPTPMLTAARAVYAAAIAEGRKDQDSAAVMAVLRARQARPSSASS
jgi:3-hydroxyisobutyrate dehydrogenase-like beta-hydroxyacid dehydrogenase